MARRSAVGNGRGTAVVDDEAAAGRAHGPSDDPWRASATGRDRGRGGGSRAGRWGGSGGRWWVWAGRAVLWAVIIVILVNGIRAPFERFTESGTQAPASGTPSSQARGTGFPSSAAGAFALQFANVYLNYDQQNAAAREAQLRTFIPDTADGQFGWNGVGRLRVQSVQVAGVDARDANNAVVTLLARTQDRWLRLAVPVYANNGALVIPARPALLPPPAKATLPQRELQERDAALEGELAPILGRFFQAYAQSDQATLSRFAERGAIAGLGDSVTFVQVKEVIAPRGDAGGRTVTATVAWQVPGATGGAELEQTYELVMVKKGSDWYVREIRGTTEPGAS